MESIGRNSLRSLGGLKEVKALGRYEILASIGSGGMAAIYLARIAGPAGFEKPFALKVVHPHLAEEGDFLDMFYDEARLAAKLQHPNIVQIFELGESAGIFYIAMEYLAGEPVDALYKVAQEQGSPFDARLCCHIAMAACEGLHCAHEAQDLEGEPLNLVHRDVSPHNFFVTYAGSVKLMDFGIARAAGATHKTRTGALRGKIAYMSPEQAAGRVVDRRSDVFSLGVVLWEMLAGRHLFRGETDLETLRRVTEGDVPPIREQRPDLPLELDVALTRALHRDRNERYPTAMEFHYDLLQVSLQLGLPMNTQDVSQLMHQWFGDEEKKKRGLLAQASRGGSQRGKHTPGEDHSPAAVSSNGAAYGSTEPFSGSEDVTPVNSPIPAIAEPATLSSNLVMAEPAPPPSGPAALGVAPMAGGAATGAHSPLPPSARRPSWLFRGAGVGLVLALAVPTAVFALRRFSGVAEGDSQPTVSTPESGSELASGTTDLGTVREASAVPPVDSRGSAQGGVTLTVETQPAEARVTVNGVVQPSPEAIELPRSSIAVEIRVEAPGYEDSIFSFVPDDNGRRAVVLTRRRRRSSNRRRAPQKAAKQPPAKQPTVPTPQKAPEKQLIDNPYRM
jgi:serine/threonine-protein kinase